MAVIYNLDVLLGARTEKFDRSLTDASRSLAAFKARADAPSMSSGRDSFDASANGIERITSAVPALDDGFGVLSRLSGELTVVGAAGAAAGVAIAGGFLSAKLAADTISATVQGIRGQLQEIDDIADAASRLGMAAGDLAKIRFAVGEATGMQADAIDASLLKMQVNLHEAASGSGVLYQMLSRLGVDPAKLLEQGPIQQLSILSAAVRELKNPTDQLRLTMELFGKQGASIVGMLREEVGQYEERLQFAQASGLGMAESQASAVGRLNDTFDRLSLSLDGLHRQLAFEIAPDVQEMLDDILPPVTLMLQTLPVLYRVLRDEASYFLGVMKDTKEVLLMTHRTYTEIVTGIATFGGDGFFADFGSKDLLQLEKAMDFGTGQRNVVARELERLTESAPGGGLKHNSELELAQIEAEMAREKELELERKRTSDAELKAAEFSKAAAEREAESNAKKVSDRIQGIQKEVEYLKQVKELMGQGFESSLAQQIARDTAELEKLVAQGATDVQLQTATDALLAKREIEQATKQAKDEIVPKSAASAIDATSSEAYKFFVDLQRNERQKQLEIDQEQLETEKRSLDVLESMLEAVKNQPRLASAR